MHHYEVDTITFNEGKENDKKSDLKKIVEAGVGLIAEKIGADVNAKLIIRTNKDIGETAEFNLIEDLGFWLKLKRVAVA